MRKFLTFVLCCCFLTSVLVARAQQTLGSLNGTVLDSSGAAIPGSTVTANDAAIGVADSRHLRRAIINIVNLATRLTHTAPGNPAHQQRGINYKMHHDRLL